MAWQPYKDSRGNKVPSVTTVLGECKSPEPLLYWAWNLGMEGRDFKEERNKAANIGTWAHKAIESYLKGIPCEDSDPKVKQALDSFLAWFHYTKIKIISQELSLVCECEKHLPYGGTLDAMGLLSLDSGDEVRVLDWKTSNAVYEDFILQVVGYAHLWEHGHIMKSGVSVPEYFNRSVSGYHILRVDKEHLAFHEHFWKATEELEKAWFACINLYYAKKYVKECL